MRCVPVIKCVIFPCLICFEDVLTSDYEGESDLPVITKGVPVFSGAHEGRSGRQRGGDRQSNSNVPSPHRRYAHRKHM
jgi:hypothetical protein